MCRENRKKITLFLTLFYFVLAVFGLIVIGSINSGCACNRSENETSYKIDCTYIDGKLKGYEKVVFYNGYDNTFKELKFNLFGNAFRKNANYKPINSQNYSKAYYNGESYGHTEITAVREKDSPLEYEICGEDQNVLSVKLDKEIFPEESVEVDIEFSLTLANVNARTGITLKTVNLGNFYPILCGVENGKFYECLYYSNGDPFFSECANYNVNITCDKDYVIASSGDLIKEEKTETQKTSYFSAKKIRSFAIVMSKEFQMQSQEVDGIDLKYYFYKDANPENSLKIAKESLEYFSNTFGKYLYNTFSVVETGFIQGGMEYPSLVMISDDLEEKEYQEVIVHETAHQWWQTAVGNNEVKYGFLDEGLTEYSVVLFYENHPEYGMKRQDMISSSEKTYRIFCSVYDKLFNKVDTSMLRDLSEYTSEYEYVNIAYIKPCIMYDTLRKTIGEEKFFKGLKRYYEKYCYKTVSPYELVGIFEKIGADSNGFFQTFFEGKAII